MDIKIKTDDCRFKFRVCGILKHNGKYLTVKVDSNNFFCFPGGHVHVGEDTETATKREMQEELGYPIKLEKLKLILQVIANKKENKNLHELGFYYTVSTENEKDIITEDYTRIENDEGKLKNLEYKWFTLDELKKIDFRPSCLPENLELEELKSMIVYE